MKMVFALLVSAFIFNAVSTQADPASVHGMLLFGGEKIYISHLPMFHAPHDYQVILEVDLGEAAKTYRDSVKADPKETVYTLVPEKFVLPDMVAKPKPFSAEIFKGHFERGGKSIGESKKVTIKKVILSKKFEKAASHPKQLEYLVFGEAAEIFAAHLITAPSDFDHILTVALKDAGMAEALKKKSPLTVQFPKATNHKPLEAPGEVLANQVGEAAVKFGLSQSLYLEFDDLK